MNQGERERGGGGSLVSRNTLSEPGRERGRGGGHLSLGTL